MAKDSMQMSVKGHITIEDDLGNVLVNKDNAVHPQNMARAISRALANEHNYYIHRIAFGNGGTTTDAAFTITYNTPNDGQPPDTSTWDSRLYRETYSEVIDDSEEGGMTLGTDPGSAGPNVGTRPGGGANPLDDPASIEHVSGPGVRSNELGLTSEVVITAVLNPGEPTGQFQSDNQAPSEDTESSFTFDEIALYTTGAPADDSVGTHDINVGNRNSQDDTTLAASTPYSFQIAVDGAAAVTIDLVTPASGSGAGGEILYGDLCEAINTGDSAGQGWTFEQDNTVVPPGTNPLPAGATVIISDTTLNFPSIQGKESFGFLRFISATPGATSGVVLAAGSGTDLIAALNQPTGGVLETAVPGAAAGVPNDPVNWATERERLLTHVIFSPVLKSANRTLTVTYTLTVSVARTAV